MKQWLHIFFILFLLFFLYRGAAQTPASHKGWYIGISGAPEYAFRTLSSKGDVEAQNLYMIRDSVERPKIGYTVGLDLQRMLNLRWVIEFGLYFSDKGENTKVYSNFTPVGPVALAQKVKYRTNYLEIPLKVNYHFNNRKFSPYLTGGISCNVYLYEYVKGFSYYRWYGNEEYVFKKIHDFGDKIELDNIDAPVVMNIQERGYYRINPQMQLGLGIDYTMNRSRVKVEPMFKYSLYDVNQGPLIRKFYSIGLNIGLFLQSGSGRARVSYSSGRLN